MSLLGRRILAASVVAAALGLAVAMCLPTSTGAERKEGPAAAGPRPERPGTPNEYPAPPPPFTRGIFPCSDCHDPKDLPTNKTRRVLKKEHKEIVLRHDEQHRWCLDCHNADDHDTLRSAAGEPIKFTESYKLCGQCHGDKYRDWRAGVHGKRTGEWNGKRTYLLCVHCHNPHSPKFKPIEPMPPPVKPVPSW